ncbi:recombination mediator RecR [Patescibacteria group bacterium]|nr:recombination mediator RecR [Patescibacteria group bacterium]
MFPPAIQKLIDLFSKFPTVGPRTAARFVFYLIRIPKEKIEELTKAIEELKSKIKLCPLCGNSFEGEEEFCPICSDGRRDKTLVCIVEKEVDLEAIEKTKKFKGVYFILGGTISGFERKKAKEKIEERVEKLINRIKEEQKIKEIILALNPTTEAQQTILWLQRKLKGLKIKITQLGRGLPKGGELEYADEETLSSAFEARK